jgi:hypothetical protein
MRSTLLGKLLVPFGRTFIYIYICLDVGNDVYGKCRM